MITLMFAQNNPLAEPNRIIYVTAMYLIPIHKNKFLLNIQRHDKMSLILNRFKELNVCYDQYYRCTELCLSFRLKR